MSSIQNHRVSFAIDAPSPNRSGVIRPAFIVMHYTAGWTAESAVNTLTNPRARVSAHVTVDRDGTIYQHVPFNVKAWHAGPSRYQGYVGLNSHSIGIEMVNPGYLRKTGAKTYQDSMGHNVSARRAEPVVESPHSRVGSGMFYWPVFPEAQLAAVEELTQDLLNVYPIIDIVSHEEIDTRGWKTDPGPAFPMPRFRRLLPHRDVDVDRYEITASLLNVREGPGASFSVVDQLQRGRLVEELGRADPWVRIDSDGWVHGDYLRRVWG